MWVGVCSPWVRSVSRRDATRAAAPGGAVLPPAGGPMASFDAKEVAALTSQLDLLRADLLTPGAAPCVHTLAERVRAANKALLEVDQPIAFEAARDAALQPSHALRLLRRAAVEDADESAGLAAASAELVATLSGSGEHTALLETATVRLRLRHRPQATGTGSRIWRSEQLAALACESGWAGARISGRRVLELGCGTAGAGLVCAALGAAAVHLTDVDQGALALATRNAALNGLTDRVHVSTLDLHTATLDVLAAAPQAAEAATPPERFDVVLASDVPYDFVDAAALVDCLVRFLAVGGRAFVVQDRDERRSANHRLGIDDCIACAARHPALSCVASEEREVQPADDDEGGGATIAMHAYALTRSIPE